MRRLYFKDNKGNTRLLDYPASTEKKALAGVYDFCKKHKFEPFYLRSWCSGNKKCYDVGSYTEFFIWADEKDMGVDENAEQ